jgi:ribonuclease BN (tRNA processing enzyme)
VKLTVIGCAGTFPGPDAACSSYLLEHDGFRLLIDLGSGALGELQRHTGVLDIDAVFVSHLHPDHFLDLVPYTYVRLYHPHGKPPALPLYGPPETAPRLNAAFGDPGHDVTEVYDVRPIEDAGELRIGPFDVRLARTAHPMECYAIRLSAGGRSVVYSGDTGPCEQLTALARGADLLLCEASWCLSVEHPADLHMSGVDAGRAATAAGVRHLVLTHLAPWTDNEVVRAEAAAEFGGELTVATRGAAYEL